MSSTAPIKGLKASKSGPFATFPVKSRFLAEGSSSVFRSQVQATLQGVFDDYDTDKDGKLAYKELAAIIKGNCLTHGL